MEKDYDEILQKALKRREEFLKEHPEYQAYQDEIDRILNATPSDKRMEVLGMMLIGKIAEFQTALLDLMKIKSEQ